jgi:hypothetical protein
MLSILSIQTLSILSILAGLASKAGKRARDTHPFALGVKVYRGGEERDRTQVTGGCDEEVDRG